MTKRSVKRRATWLVLGVATIAVAAFAAAPGCATSASDLGLIPPAVDAGMMDATSADTGAGMDSTTAPDTATAIDSSTAADTSVAVDTGIVDAGQSDSAIVVCTSLAAALCQQLDLCSHFLVQLEFGDVATCSAREALKCEANLLAPGVTLTPAAAQGCFDYGDLTCADLEDGVLPPGCPSFPTGTLEAGASCQVGWQCAGGDCRKPSNELCGKCRAYVVDAGASCDASDCEPGLKCTKDEQCVRYGAAGKPCEEDSGAACQFPLACVSHECVSVGGIGATCVVDGGTCDPSLGLICNAVSKTCATIVIAAPGGACGVGADGTLTQCPGGGACKRVGDSSTMGMCDQPVLEGQPCGPNGPVCFFPAFCTAAGVCALPQPDTCQGS